MTAQNPYVILVAVDFSEHARIALGAAKNLALQHPTAELHVVHVVPPPIGNVAVVGSTDMAATFTETLDRTRVELQEACTEIARGMAERVYGHVRTGRPSKEITEVANQISADMIVVGTHGRTGLSRALLGSVAEEVVRHAPCDVLTVRRRPDVPAIEPACPDCTKAQAAANDPHARCTTHQRRHARPHTYSDGQEGLFHQSFRFD
ncbi:MAG: universal stress protein [Polyangiaceae bacterium]